MKKRVLVLALVLSILLSACGGSPASDTPKAPDDSAESTPVESLPAESDSSENVPDEPTETEPPESTPIESGSPVSTGNILLDSELMVQDVMNGSGTEVIGQRAYINISADQLKEITSDSLVEFAENCVKNSGYNWVSIIADNGNGIFFSGSIIEIIEYGKMGNEGMLDETIGFLTLSDGVYTYSEN